MARILALLFGQGWADEVPLGHLEPFGSWAPGEAVEERSDVPTPEEFFKTYSTADGGYGRPVIFRGAASGWKAIDWTNDDDLLRRFGSERVTGVEHNLKETRAGGQVDGMETFRDFLKAYNNSDIYMVSSVPKKMMKEVEFLPCMTCGGYLNFLDAHNFWMGRGGSKSVVHYDDQDNINCMIAGEKRFIFMHPSYKHDFEAFPNSKKNRYGWVDTDLDRSLPGYGAFMGRIDVDRMDLIKYPGWKDVKWSYADLKPGDCLYIPYQWYHQVTAHPGRSINVHIWYWRPAKFETSCEQAAPPTFADCTWGWEPKKGHLGKLQKGWPKPTKCRAKRGSKEL